MLKILCADCLGLSPAILSQFTFEMCVAARNGEKFTKAPIVGVQSHSRSLTVTSLKKLVASACYDMQHVCAYLQPFSR